MVIPLSPSLPQPNFFSSGALTGERKGRNVDQKIWPAHRNGRSLELRVAKGTVHKVGGRKALETFLSL